jgi:hypothetical protein
MLLMLNEVPGRVFLGLGDPQRLHERGLASAVLFR